jgi:hypothetical protein
LENKGVGFFSGLLPVYITSLCKLGRQKIFWYVAKTPENKKPLFAGCLKKTVYYFLVSLLPLFLPAKQKHSSLVLAFGDPAPPKAKTSLFGGRANFKIVCAFAFQPPQFRRPPILGWSAALIFFVPKIPILNFYKV